MHALKPTRPSRILAVILSQLWTIGSASAEEPATLKLVQTIRLKGVSGRLDHFAIDHEHGRLFVANLSNNSLEVIDLASGKVTKQIPGQKKIQGIAYAPDLDRIFVGNGAGGECNVFDGRDYTLLKSVKLPGADNVRYRPGRQQVFVGHEENALTCLDAKTLEVKATVALPGGPEGFQIESKRPLLYLNTVNPTFLVVVDVDRNEVLHRHQLHLADRAYPMALDEADRRIFIGCRNKPSVVVVDSETGKEVTSVGIPADTDDVFYDAKRRRIYASCGSGFLAVIQQRDADHYETLETIPTVKLARTCFFDAKGDRLYLTVPRQEGEDGPTIRVYQPAP